MLSAASEFHGSSSSSLLNLINLEVFHYVGGRVCSKAFGSRWLQESRALAEIAKAELDDVPLKGRQLRVRFATHSAALSVRNLSPYVSNELLEEAFSQFGQVERAVVIVDDRGRSLGKGIVEFASKPAARKAMERCNEGVFLLTT